jgi:NAD-dependent SIR2 family protein deacetylase
VEALSNGARLVLINRGETYVDVRAEVILRGDVADLLPLIVKEVLLG